MNPVSPLLPAQTNSPSVWLDTRVAPVPTVSCSFHSMPSTECCLSYLISFRLHSTRKKIMALPTVFILFYSWDWIAQPRQPLGGGGCLGDVSRTWEGHSGDQWHQAAGVEAEAHTLDCEHEAERANTKRHKSLNCQSLPPGTCFEQGHAS